MERIGVLGLGRMGLPVARRLVNAGHSVTAFDPSRDRAALAAEAGAQIALDEYEVAGHSDVFVTVLPGPAELREAMLGHPAALSGLRPGACWLDLTSNDPRVAAEVATAARAAGVSSVGAPMAGGPRDAAGASLGFYLGGDPDAVQRVRPLLELLGDVDRFLPVGDDVGAGHTTKLLANTLWFGQAVAVTEMLLLGQSLGLDLRTLRTALETSPGGSSFLTNHVDALLSGDYLTTFGIERIVEELDTVTSLASDAGTPYDLTRVVSELHREALDRFGPVDGELLAAKLLETRAGRTLRA